MKKPRYIWVRIKIILSIPFWYIGTLFMTEEELAQEITDLRAELEELKAERERLGLTEKND